MPQTKKAGRSRAAGRDGRRRPSIKLDLLVDGIFVTDKRLFLPEGRGEVYRGVAKCLLIRTGNEKILIDTGIGSTPDLPKYELLKNRVAGGRQAARQGRSPP
jgi:hypothetical protein